ncbi:hypothetical protein BD311DRAFT_567233 [Dichomitus squalens]|uniref:Uncharacterized protein n=1 Tax=Dichomitus squalens TaxID=114155 RepID=A0A4Q9MCZ2_9APHY|nr:hypothetical protein BD311DRAFT_567233 [Dichomitus squalens]
MAPYTDTGNYADAQPLVDAEKILTPITLPCGRVVPNRLVKVNFRELLFTPRATIPCLFAPRVISHCASQVTMTVSASLTIFQK